MNKPVMDGDWILAQSLLPPPNERVLIASPNIQRIVIAKLHYEFEHPMGWVYYDIGGKNTLDVPNVMYWKSLGAIPESVKQSWKILKVQPGKQKADVNNS